MTNILESLRWRYAVKKFDANKKVKEEDIQDLINAFVLSPSSLNLQPWKLIYVENMKKRKEMAPFCWNDSQILDSTGVFVLTRVVDISDRLVDRLIDFIVEQNFSAREDLKEYEIMMKTFLSGLSVNEKIHWADRQVMINLGNMMDLCAMKKIDSCPIEGFKKEKIDEILQLSEKGLASVVLLPIGYRDENDHYLQRGKIRYTKEMVFEKI